MGTVSTSSGVACDCAVCGTPQWYDHGVCQGCESGTDFEHTWIAQCDTGGTPKSPPDSILQLEGEVGDRLVTVWADLVLLRGLSPYLVPPTHSVVQYSSADWYVERGVQATVQYLVPADPGFAERLNRASSWANQSLLVRLVSTFEAFLDCGRNLSQYRFPRGPGMREFHHARRLRNAVAHGDPLIGGRLTDEALDLFGSDAVVAGACNLDISIVLEPLWARLLIYARSLDTASGALSECPAVVAAVRGNEYILQTLTGVQRVQSDTGGWVVGDLLALSDTRLGPRA